MIGAGLQQKPSLVEIQYALHARREESAGKSESANNGERTQRGHEKLPDTLSHQNLPTRLVCMQIYNEQWCEYYLLSILDFI